MSDGKFEADFRTAFRDRYPELFRWLDRYCGDPAVAADAAQETFVRLYRRGEMPDDLRGWLVSVALNLVRDEQRRGGRRRQLILHRSPETTMADVPRSPEEEVLAAEQRMIVRRALDRMSPRDRALLLLREEGYSYRELAVALELNEASVGTLLARAKSAFREVYMTAANTTAEGNNDARS